LPSRRVGEFNQSLMELGALVCTPRQPKCPRCPVADLCASRKQGLQDDIPVSRPGPATTRVREAAVVICRRKEVLLVQRPAQGRWANLWEFPHQSVPAGEAEDGVARELIPELTGLRARLGAAFLTVRHGVTRFQVAMTCFHARFAKGRFRSPFYQRAAWVRPERLADYPLSVPQRKIARALLHGRLTMHTAPSRNEPR
jgi:A/G-specific adenine glycosylase